MTLLKSIAYDKPKAPNDLFCIKFIDITINTTAQIKFEKKPKLSFRLLLPDLDSNQDKQYQKLSYYHYTIGHPANPFLVWERKNMGGGTTTQIFKSSILKKLEINTKTS